MFFVGSLFEFPCFRPRSWRSSRSLSGLKALIFWGRIGLDRFRERKSGAGHFFCASRLFFGGGGVRAGFARGLAFIRGAVSFCLRRVRSPFPIFYARRFGELVLGEFARGYEARGLRLSSFPCLRYSILAPGECTAGLFLFIWTGRRLFLPGRTFEVLGNSMLHHSISSSSRSASLTRRWSWKRDAGGVFGWRTHWEAGPFARGCGARGLCASSSLAHLLCFVSDIISNLRRWVSECPRAGLVATLALICAGPWSAESVH